MKSHDDKFLFWFFLSFYIAAVLALSMAIVLFFFA